jgi:hypothetical protein
MRVDQRFLGWGLFFLALGAVPLAVRANLLTADVAGGAWRLWPLLLVAIGIGILLRGSRAAAIGGLAVALTFGSIGGGMLAGGWVDLGALACGDARSNGTPVVSSGQLDAAAQVTLEQRCGDLNVHMSDGSTWSLSSSGDDPAPPEVSATSRQLRIRSNGRHGMFFIGMGGQREAWDVGLPRGSRIDLETTLDAGSGHLDLRTGHFASLATTVNAGDMRIDLDGATAPNLALTVNAGDVRVVLPASSSSGSITVNAGSVRLCAPAGAGLRFTTNENITSSYDFGLAGLVKSGSTWTTPGFASAAIQVDFSTTVNAGSLALNPSQGCR